MSDKPKTRLITHTNKLALVGDVLEHILDGLAIGASDIKKIKEIVEILRNPKAEIDE